MLFSLNWIKEFVDVSMADSELSDKLTMSGFEVDGVAVKGAALDGVITVKILEKIKHPNADKLSLCQVDTGVDTRQIVCGATNMEVGDVVPLATVGTHLPGDFKIKKSKIRGEVSEGMLCSEVELGVADDADGLLILPKDTKAGLDIDEVLSGKAESDSIFDIAITPNRPDCFSVRGMAREIAVELDSKFKEKKIKYIESGSKTTDLVSVKIEKGTNCRRYMAVVVEGVKIAPSPTWIKNKLEVYGIRSINNVVDITNLVMLEYGHPMHGFDLDKIKSKKIVVRVAKDKEIIKTLDEVERKLNSSVTVITDGDKPIAVAGIMGDQESQVSGDTTNVLLECAYFDNASIRRASRKLGLSTDSSYRFERGIDIGGLELAIQRAASLMSEICSGTISEGIIDEYVDPIETKEVGFRIDRAQSILGLKLNKKNVRNTFEALGIECSEREGKFFATPPTYRGDITFEEDLIEEIARLTGFDSIPAKMPVATLTKETVDSTHSLKNKIRNILVGAEMMEVINYSFVPPSFTNTFASNSEPVEILNPLADNESVLRDSLIPSLLNNATYNIDRESDSLRLFELGPAFLNKKGVVTEKWKVSGLLYGNRDAKHWSQDDVGLDFYDLKGVVIRLLKGLKIDEKIEINPSEGCDFLHPTRGAFLSKRGNSKENIGFFGELSPKLQGALGFKNPPYVFEIDINSLVQLCKNTINYKGLPKFPASSRDVAMVVKQGVKYSDIEKQISSESTKVIEIIELFDVYYGKGIPEDSKSLALRVTYRLPDGTLKSTEVDALHSKVLENIVKIFGAEIR